MKAILRASRNWKTQGYEFEAAEARWRCSSAGAQKSRPPFKVETYHVSMRRDHKESICEATVRSASATSAAEVAEGDGPVNALDGALRPALVKSFPQFEKITLTDYKVRILDTTTGTAAKTRVLIESSDGKREWGTVGVSENIIEASLQALVDSMELPC